MVKRKQETIGFNEDEKARIIVVADGESFSGYVRRQVMNIVKEEESQK